MLIRKHNVIDFRSLFGWYRLFRAIITLRWYSLLASYQNDVTVRLVLYHPTRSLTSHDWLIFLTLLAMRKHQWTSSIVLSSSKKSPGGSFNLFPAIVCLVTVTFVSLTLLLSLRLHYFSLDWVRISSQLWNTLFSQNRLVNTLW